jgi:hypothetical protein
MSYLKIQIPRPEKIKSDLNEYLTRGQKAWYTVTEHYLTDENLYMKLEPKVKSTVKVTDWEVSSYNGFGTPMVEIDGKKWVALSDTPMRVHEAHRCLERYIADTVRGQRDE